MNDIKTIFGNLWMITLFDHRVCTPNILVLLLMYK